MDSKGSQVPVSIYGDSAQECPVLSQTTQIVGYSPTTSVCRTGIWRLVSQQGCGLGWSCFTGTQMDLKAPAPLPPSSGPGTKGPNHVIREPNPGRTDLSRNHCCFWIQQSLHPALQMPSQHSPFPTSDQATSLCSCSQNISHSCWSSVA
jgi:hypothetical protein